MLEIKNTEVYGLERSLIASGNPMRVGVINTLPEEPNYNISVIGQSDIDRGVRLGKAPAGSGHDNFLSGIVVQFDVKYPQYWSMEFQRYHFIQIISSQSKMHKLVMMGKDGKFENMFNKYVDNEIIEKLYRYITAYEMVDLLEEIEDKAQRKYELFMKIVSNLPMGFEMWMTVSTNYLQLKTIYNQRSNHKLKEDWGAFCKWCEELPMFLELIGKK